LLDSDFLIISIEIIVPINVTINPIANHCHNQYHIKYDWSQLLFVPNIELNMPKKIHNIIQKTINIFLILIFFDVLIIMLSI
jgi:hypothetical protein